MRKGSDELGSPTCTTTSESSVPNHQGENVTAPSEPPPVFNFTTESISVDDATYSHVDLAKKHKQRKLKEQQQRNSTEIVAQTEDIETASLTETGDKSSTPPTSPPLLPPPCDSEDSSDHPPPIPSPLVSSPRSNTPLDDDDDDDDPNYDAVGPGFGKPSTERDEIDGNRTTVTSNGVETHIYDCLEEQQQTYDSLEPASDGVPTYDSLEGVQKPS